MKNSDAAHCTASGEPPARVPHRKTSQWDVLRPSCAWSFKILSRPAGRDGGFAPRPHPPGDRTRLGKAAGLCAKKRRAKTFTCLFYARFLPLSAAPASVFLPFYLGCSTAASWRSAEKVAALYSTSTSVIFSFPSRFGYSP